MLLLLVQTSQETSQRLQRNVFIICSICDLFFAHFRPCLQVARLADPLKDAERVLAVRQAVGPRIRLRADANQAWTLAQACAFGRSAAPAQLQVRKQTDSLKQATHALNASWGKPIESQLTDKGRPV